MFPTLMAYLRDVSKRFVIYAGCVCLLSLASVFFGLHGASQARKNIPTDYCISAASPQHPPKLVASYGKLPLSFEVNQGQVDPQVKFLSRGQGYTLFLTGDEAVLALGKPSGVRKKLSAFSSQLSANRIPGSQSWNPIEGGGKLLALPGRSQRTTDHGPRTTPLIQNPKSKIENEFVRLRLVGANPNAEVVGSDDLPGKANYFIGNDPKKWRTNVPTYAKVRYHDVYPGVDLEYYGNQSGQLEYDFIVAPGADLGAITLHVGADQEPPARIDQGGDLVVAAQGGGIRFHKPLIYQPSARSSLITGHSSTVQGRFVVDARNRIHFALGPYDRTKPLVIDPVLSYSTYLGGSAGDWGYGIAVDSSGSAYATGETASVDFPTVNPLQPNNNSSGLSTCFVAKLNPTGSALVYSTYLGGNGGDTGYGIAVDSSGSAYVAGRTYSPDFPTVNAFQSTNQSSVVGGTGFIAKLNASGSALVYSTYLGGSVADAVRSVAVDSPGNAHVTGYTLSIDFPVTPGAFQTAGPGGTCNALTNPSPCDEAFVAELNASGSALVYSTYLGGSNYNAGFGIAVDSSGNAYVAGTTTSIDFPTADPFQATLHGSSNAFVTKLNASGSGLIYSTYLGGSSLDQGTAISVDSSGSAYVTGYTASSDFPTVNPLQPTIGAQGHACGYVAKLNPSGSALVYSTYLGGSVGEMAFGIGVDGSGDAYVVGLTMSPNFPTVNPIQSVNQATGGALISPSTAFVSELNAAGSALIYSTYLGGSVQDTASAVAVDPSGNAYITGNTLSPDFPTVNPLQPTNNNAQQPGPTAFVAELSAGPAPAVSFSPAAFGFGGVLEDTTSPQKTVAVTNFGNASLTITGITANGDFAVVASATSCFYTVSTLAPEANCTVTVTFTPTALGVRTGAVMVTDNASGSPQALQLTGTGGLPAAIVSATGLNFQAQNVGTASSPLAVTLTNTASVALPVSNVTISSGWAQSNNCVPSVGPSASCTINVTFQPTAGGYFTGTLTLTDEAVNSPQTVTLSGIGQGGPASLSPTSLVFGDQPVGSASLSQTITLVSPNNGGPGVPEFAISGDFQQDNSCDSMTNLTTDYPCPITIWFQPSAVGTRTGTLSVTYAQPTPTTLTASLTGTGVAPEASVAPAALTFGNQVQGTASSPQAVTLSNTGNVSLVISNLTISGDFSETNTCGSSVAANTSCTVNVVFTPTAPGTRAGTLTINDNSNNVPGGSTQTVNLSGTGVGPVVSLSPTGLTFAAQTVSTQSAPQTITLTNTGNGALTPLTITASGDFAQTNTCTGSVGASASCTISATFKPTTGGARSGALTLTDNASNSPQTIQLSGTGMDFTMSSSATSQTVSPGQVANYSATLDPESGYDDTVNLTCTGAPSLSTCTLTPNRVTLNGTASATVAVAVSTTAPSLTPPQQWLLPRSLRGLRRMFWLYALLGLASLAALARARKRRAAYLLGGCLLLVVLWAACGGGGGQIVHTSGTPPGTYTVDVTATDATTSALARTLQLTLTVN
jgi:hypothetical protein